MATQIRVWEINDKKLVPVGDASFADFHKEAELEDWITQNPNILGEDLLVILRQKDIPGVGRLDLLCMDARGQLVIVELKRDLSPRESVAQALDYASWLDSASEGKIRDQAEEYLKGDLDVAFQQYFHTERPELDCQNHRILLVAARLDAPAERIINYLNERHSVDINAIFITYSKLSDGKEMLIRSVLVADQLGAGERKGGGTRPSENALMAIAADRNTLALLEICRRMKDVWREVRQDTGGGSYRYWADKPDGGLRMVFGINVSGGLANPPAGQLDVWVRPDALAEVTGSSEAAIRQRLSEISQPFSAFLMDFMIRVKSTADAEQLVTKLKDFVAGHSGTGEQG